MTTINFFQWVFEIPQKVAPFVNWLTTPINTTYLNVTPLAFFGIGTILLILGVHIVRLFVV